MQLPTEIQASYESILNAIDAVVFELEYPSCRCTFISKQVERTLGYPVDTWLADPNFWANHIHPEDRVWAVDFCAQATAQGRHHQFEYRMTAADGRTVWFRDHVRVLVGADGLPRRVHGVMFDITQRKKEEVFLAAQTRILQLISGGAPLDDVLATLVHLIEAQSEGLICSILLLDDDERVHHIAAPSLPESFVKAIDGLRIGPSAGSCGTAMYLGRPVVVSDLRTDPLWEDYRDAAQPLGVLACWSTPIFIEKHRVVGSFAIYCRDPRSPTDEETKLIDIATYIAAIAIERTRATQALLLKHEQIRDLAGKLIAAQEEERKRVARDLHDDLGQKIASVGMHISAVKKTLAARSEPIRRKLEAVEDEIDTLMNDLRELSHELYPTLLRRVGLEAALRSLCEEFSRSEEIDLLFSFPQPVVAIPENIALCLYRVAQEALRNIAKHARAKHIDVVISAADGQIDLRVSDDGRGFDREDMKLQGLGINNMEERVRLCHGRFQITSELGLGTTVRVQIRLTDS